MDGFDNQQTAGEIYRLALNVRAAWDQYFSALAPLVERGRTPHLTQSLALARIDVERAERRLFAKTEEAFSLAAD